jgi:hypothetical protein
MSAPSSSEAQELPDEHGNPAGTIYEIPFPGSSKCHLFVPLGIYDRLLKKLASPSPVSASAPQSADFSRHHDFLGVGGESVQPATPRSEPPDRDKDWVLAMAHALGLDSGFEIPIVPEVEVFKRFFASLRSETPAGGTAKVPDGIVLLPLRKEQVQAALRALGQIGIALPSPDGNEEPK